MLSGGNRTSVWKTDRFAFNDLFCKEQIYQFKLFWAAIIGLHVFWAALVFKSTIQI